MAAAASFLGVAAVMLLVWLGVDPEAHEHFHADAGLGDHHCVITDFAAGEGYFLVPRMLTPPVGVVYETLSRSVREASPGRVDYALLPARGPPGAPSGV